MTSCKDVTRKIASDEFREAGWGERLVVPPSGLVSECSEEANSYTWNG